MGLLDRPMRRVGHEFAPSWRHMLMRAAGFEIEDDEIPSGSGGGRLSVGLGGPAIASGLACFLPGRREPPRPWVVGREPARRRASGVRPR
jgi:hypothetical protein